MIKLNLKILNLNIVSMKFITTIINTLKTKNIQTPLGRWGMEKCITQMTNKIDLSNEDHCGPCGQYALEKLESKNNKKIDDIHSEKSK